MAVTNLAAGATSRTSMVSAPFQWAWDFRFTNGLEIVDDSRVCFQGIYICNGETRDLGFPHLLFSRPGYTMMVRLQEDDYAVTHGELLPSLIQARRDVEELAAAIEQLRSDTGMWPNGNPSHIPGANEVSDLTKDSAGLLGATSIYQNWQGLYIDEIRKDPWGRHYFFDPDYLTNGVCPHALPCARAAPKRIQSSSAKA